MNALKQWAERWLIPEQAMDEFNSILGIDNYEAERAKGEGEARVQSRIALEASKLGYRLWRNNVGAYEDNYGNFIRYGLANESTKMNKVVKSSDLIGIKPVLITKAHVNKIIGQFVAREVKKSTWKYAGNAHEVAQLNYINIVNSLGGDARFAQGVGSFSIEK